MKSSYLMLFIFFIGFIPAISFANPCNEDVQKHCSSVTAGDGRVAVCLNSNRKKISSRCRKYIDKSEKAKVDLLSDCYDESKRFCSDVKPGKGRRKVCLEQHKNRLTAKCSRSLREASKY